MKNITSSPKIRRYSALLAVMLFTFLPDFVFSQSVFGKIAETGELRAGVLNGDHYPFVYTHNNTFAGYEITLIEEMARSLSVPYEVQGYSDTEALVNALNRGEIQVAFGKLLKDLSITERVFVSSPLGTVKLNMVLNRRSYGQLKTGGDLAVDIQTGKVPLVTQNTEQFVLGLEHLFPGKTVRPEQRNVPWTELLNGKNYLAFVTDNATTRRYFSQNPEKGILLRIFPLEWEMDVVALASWKDDYFWEWLNIFIEGQGRPKEVTDLTDEF